MPVVDPRAYVHPEAILIGDVVIEAECFIGPGAVLRGDLARITVQTGANVQDNCVIHSYPQQETRLAPASHIGHSAVLHGCSVGRGVGRDPRGGDGRRGGWRGGFCRRAFVCRPGGTDSSAEPGGGDAGAGRPPAERSGDRAEDGGDAALPALGAAVRGHRAAGDAAGDARARPSAAAVARTFWRDETAVKSSSSRRCPVRLTRAATFGRRPRRP